MRWFRLGKKNKNGGGALNPRPLVSSLQNPFVFQQPIGRKFPAEKRTFVGKWPQREGAGGSGISGTPLWGEALGSVPGPGLARGLLVCLFVPGGAGPGGAPSPSPAPPQCPSLGGEGVAPHHCKGESVLSSSPTPHQRIKKKIKTQPRKRFCVGFLFSPLSLVWGRIPPKAPLAALRSSPKTTSRRAQPFCRAHSSLLTICFSLGKVSGAILWPTHRGYICSKCWVASAG